MAGNWGRVRFGRVNELTTETIRKFDPFYQYSMAGMYESSLRSARISNTARYDSPKWSGFSFGLSYSLGRGTGTHDERNANDYHLAKDWVTYEYKDRAGNINTLTKLRDVSNDGYALNVSYNNGPLMLTANWSRLADSADSYNWNAGAAYKFGGARISLLYEQTRDKAGMSAGGGQRASADWGSVSEGLGGNASSKQQNWVLGLEWDIGPGQFDASVNYLKVDEYGYASRATSWDNDDTAMKYAVGYTYNLSKRTSVYGMVAYEDIDEKLAREYFGTKESTFGVQIGMTHKF